MEEANNLIGAGKKHLVMGKVVEAVAALQEACGMLAKKYGDTADECGEAFYWCGKALLDLARMENSVLGNALEGVPEEEESEEVKHSNFESTENLDEKTRDELREQVYDAMAEKENEKGETASGNQNGDAAKEHAVPEREDEKAKEGGEETRTDVKANGADESGSKSAETDDKIGKGEEVGAESASKPTDGPDEAEDGGEEEGEEEEEGDAEMEGDESEAEGQDEGEDAAEKEDDEEVGNLQLAWEMLEVAKVIYKRKDAKEDQLMAAQAHLKLGEVSTESGNYKQALEDLQECLSLQLKHLDSDSRLLAETHYQLGLTFGLDNQFSQAIEALNCSIAVIKSRLDKLQEAVDKAEGPDAVPDERKELEELQSLLPEIQEKVEDARAAEKMVAAGGEALKEVLNGGSSLTDAEQNGANTASSSTKDSSSSTSPDTKTPVTDISHLVRKKRRQEESPVKEGTPKKLKQEGAQTNGEPVTSSTNGTHVNGDSKHTASMEVER